METLNFVAAMFHRYIHGTSVWGYRYSDRHCQKKKIRIHDMRSFKYNLLFKQSNHVIMRATRVVIKNSSLINLAKLLQLVKQEPFNSSGCTLRVPLLP